MYRLARIYDEAKYGLHSLLGLHKIVRHRAALVRMRTKLKNKIHSVMFMTGTSISYVGTHTFTEGYIEKLKELNDYRINGYLRIIESLNDEINTVSKKILPLAQEDEMAKLLMTVPGIGYYSALLIVKLEISIDFLILIIFAHMLD